MKLNGITIPTPENDVQITPIEIGVEDRTTSGRMVKDIKATKHIFVLPYSGLLPVDALIFINAYKSGNPVPFEYEDVEGAHTKNVFINPLPRKIYNPKPEYTKDVTITLEEE